MEIGERRTVVVDSREHWNNTGIMLKGGCRYATATSGMWHDANKACDATGWVSDSALIKDLEHFRRVRDDNWFALIGACDQNRRTEFLIGNAPEFTAPQDGELTCFANDAPFMYWNNSGSIELTVTRLT